MYSVKYLSNDLLRRRARGAWPSHNKIDTPNTRVPRSQQGI